MYFLIYPHKKEIFSFCISPEGKVSWYVPLSESAKTWSKKWKTKHGIIMGNPIISERGINRERFCQCIISWWRLNKSLKT
jgi:hypothetical protein